MCSHCTQLQTRCKSQVSLLLQLLAVNLFKFKIRDFFAKMVVDAVLKLDEDLNIDLIGIKKESGGALQVFIYFNVEYAQHLMINNRTVCW